ncbi:MAG: hypothetical protein EA365_15210, partial [Gloeocapsa sp. DLM2.Bin57]
REDGNSLRRAVNLGSLSNLRIQDFVGENDSNDYYRFSVNRTTDLNLTLNRLSADADVMLLDSDGTGIAISNRGGTRAENINETLEPGTYYIRVYAFEDANTDYNLRLRTSSSNNNSRSSINREDGNSLRRAVNLGSLSNLRIQDFVGENDSNDYYRFSVNRTTDLNLTLNRLSADADVMLLDSDGTGIAISNRGGTRAENINETLEPGTYYIRVYAFEDANTDYNLRLRTSSSNNNSRSSINEDALTNWLDHLNNLVPSVGGEGNNSGFPRLDGSEDALTNWLDHLNNLVPSVGGEGNNSGFPRLDGSEDALTNWLDHLNNLVPSVGGEGNNSGFPRLDGSEDALTNWLDHLNNLVPIESWIPWSEVDLTGIPGSGIPGIGSSIFDGYGY